MDKSVLASTYATTSIREVTGVCSMDIDDNDDLSHDDL
jgi:hypothetical protein